eukprot:jgi/Mesvir1/29445/Mv23024-RA.2
MDDPFPSRTLNAVQCRNVGSDGRDIQWKCEADLPRHLRFAKTEVTCEGYSYPDDPDILEGSCGLEYSLKRDKSAGSGYGYESSHSHRSQDGWGHEHSHRHHERYRMPTSTGTNLGQWLMYGVLAFIAYGLYKQCTGARNQPRTFGRGFAAGDTRPSAPPPPGYPHDDYGPGGPPGGGGYGGYGGGSYWSQQAAPAAGGGLGGWGGLVGGLGLGYLLGRPRGTMHGYGYGQPAYGGRTGGWGWGGWGRSATATTTTTSPRHNSSASSSFGGTHTSTAYAGTRRR